MTLYFEDVAIGETFSNGSKTLTERDIIEFAEEYDPLPMHTDPAAAKETSFGKLIASGWQTASVCQSLYVTADEVENFAHGYGRGLSTLEWRKPVFAGDTLRVEGEIVNTSPAGENFGHVDTKIRGFNQHDECVIMWVGQGALERERSIEDSGT